MQRFISRVGRRIVGLAAAAVTMAGAGGWHAVHAASWDRDYFPNVPLLTHTGEEVRFVDDILGDKIAVVSFIYTDCPDICGLTTARLAKVHDWLGDRVGDDIVFVSVTITPETDTPEKLRAYADAFGVGDSDGWYFVTGSREDIDQVRFKLGERSSTLSEHRSDMVIGNMALGTWRRTSLMGNLLSATEDILELDPDWEPVEAMPAASGARPLKMRDNPGEGLFQKACAACHSIGDGVRVGPDLAGVTLRRDRAWLMRYIMSPARVLAEGDLTAVALDAAYPAVRMPTFGLGESDVADLIEYLHGETQELDGSGFAAEAEGGAHDHADHDHDHGAHDHGSDDHEAHDAAADSAVDQDHAAHQHAASADASEPAVTDQP